MYVFLTCLLEVCALFDTFCIATVEYGVMILVFAGPVAGMTVTVDLMCVFQHFSP
jgi:hypothetical protein